MKKCQNCSKHNKCKFEYYFKELKINTCPDFQIAKK